MSALGLYVHLPFCRHRCSYCHFIVVPGTGVDPAPYIHALDNELVRAANEIERPLTSVFIGGGTPSYLDVALLERVVATIGEHYELADDAEWTIEANPESATAQWLARVRRLGIGRLSLGVQSFDPTVLEVLERIHTAERARQALREARAAGFDSLSLDLMYGCPGQSLDGFVRDVETVLEHAPDHVSMYALDWEERSRLLYKRDRGLLSIPDDDEVAAMYEQARDALSAWDHYELSNWARPGHACRHNLTYWRRGEYIGAGLGAHSYLRGVRFSSPANLRKYLDTYASSTGVRVEENAEVITLEMALAEELFLGLRLREGVSIPGLEARYGEPVKAMHTILEQYRQAGLVETDGDRYTLTQRGQLLSDSVFSQLV